MEKLMVMKEVPPAKMLRDVLNLPLIRHLDGSDGSDCKMIFDT